MLTPKCWRSAWHPDPLSPSRITQSEPAKNGASPCAGSLSSSIPATATPGARAQTPADARVDEMPAGGLETARLFGRRVAEVAARFRG